MGSRPLKYGVTHRYYHQDGKSDKDTQIAEYSRAAMMPCEL